MDFMYSPVNFAPKPTNGRVATFTLPDPVFKWAKDDKPVSDAGSAAASGQTAAARRQRTASQVVGELDAPLRAHEFDTAKFSQQAIDLSAALDSPDDNDSIISDALRSTLQELTAQKRDLDSHIDAILKKNGIKLGAGDKIKLETGAKGKIAVSGIQDPELRKEIENALNKEKGLFEKVRDNQVAMRKASSEFKHETGMTLKEAMEKVTANEGDGQATIDMAVGKDADGKPVVQSNSGSMIHFDDELAGLLFDMQDPTGVAVVTDSRANAEPVDTLKSLLKNAERDIRQEFMWINREVKGTVPEELPTDAAGNPIPREHLMMDVTRVEISVSSDKEITISGQVAIDPKKDREGKEIIERKIKEMLETTTESGDTKLFDEAMTRILSDYHLEYGDEAAPDATAVVEIGRENTSGQVRMSSPRKEAELLDEMSSEVNGLLEEKGILDPQYKVEVDDDGKLVIANLPENEEEKAKVLDALDEINNSLASADEEDEKYGRLKELVDHYGLFQGRGLSDLGTVDDEDETVTPYDSPGAKQYGGIIHAKDPEIELA
ncbi:MAG: hypothetical protein LIQ31_08335 [Planctomycetes bacterium]|nr:hypothetical protein [Planctomycetota bacterium]